MGSLRGEDGDGRTPPDNGGLPDLPPEWGTVVIPDDLTELGRETADYQRATRRAARRNRWRRRFGLMPKPESDSPPVGIPLLIMCIAIVAALTSLFAVTVTTHKTPEPTTTTTGPAPQTTPTMIDLGLADSSGKIFRTVEHLPAVFLLLDGCACGQLITETAAAAPAAVTVVVVDKTPPFIALGTRATALGDPTQALLALYGAGADWNDTPAGVPTALLVNSAGTVTATISPAFNVADFQTALAALS
jgi:hypothetical protein